jgi:two-component system response regulator YesN
MEQGPGSRVTGSVLMVQKAKEYIEEHCREKFSLKKMSGELYVNGSYLLRIFRKHTGYTLLGYHNHVRCEKAKELLRRPDVSISDVGETVGFVSSSHFSHVFRKTEGCTPSEYRLRFLPEG